jgi:hypothetical protein
VKDAWFVFDLFLVTLYAIDPFILAIVSSVAGGGGFNGGAVPRLLRLARLSRLVRMFKYNAELMILVKAIGKATSSVAYTLALLIIVTYVFAIAMTQLAGAGSDNPLSIGEEGSYNSGVARSMYTLIIYGVFLDDLAAYAWDVKEDSTVCLVLLVLFIVLGSMTILNMLIGVLCEVITAVAEEERQKLMTDLVYIKFTAIVKQLDANNDGTISWDEFQQIMEMPEAMQAFEACKVDPDRIMDFAEDWFIDQEGRPQQLSLSEFMEMVLDLRGDKSVTIEDVMRERKRMSYKFAEMFELHERMSDKVARLAVLQGNLVTQLSHLRAQQKKGFY